MKKYLSHGMGVNSTALMLFLEKKGIEFESVFVDHGGDYPETYEYLEYLKDEGYSITVIIPEVEGCHTIEEYCIKYRIIPIRQLRWCTDKFKIRVLYKYFEKPCISYIGICKDEEKRVFASKHIKDIANIYPLIEKGITRNDCIKIIQDHSLRVPPKSGCWFCPFSRKSEIRQLMLNHPDLYKKRKFLEHNCQRDDLFLTQNTPIEKVAMENIPSLESFIIKLQR